MLLKYHNGCYLELPRKKDGLAPSNAQIWVMAAFYNMEISSSTCHACRVGSSERRGSRDQKKLATSFQGQFNFSLLRKDGTHIPTN